MRIGIVLAAGKGTRMGSDLPKVLHLLNGKPLLHWVMDASFPVTDKNIVVVGHSADLVRSAVMAHDSGAVCVVQEPQRGTGHAVQCAMPVIPENAGVVLVLCGDVPLIRQDTIRAMMEAHIRDENAMTVMGIEQDPPDGYGRLVTSENGGLLCIVEEPDATAEQKRICLVNAGIYCFSYSFLKNAIFRISAHNAQGELYLTDLVEIAVSGNQKVGVFLCADSSETMGVNTPSHLSLAAETLALLHS